MLKNYFQFLPVSPVTVLVAGMVMVPVAANACGSDPYIGEVCTFAIRYCPQGFMEANGQLLQVSQYQALYALLGTTYGGTANQNFALPDLRGRVAVGGGQGSSYSVQLGQQVGVQNVTLQASNIPAHLHPASFAATTGSQTVRIPSVTGNLNVSASLPVSTNVGTTAGTMSALGNGQAGYLAGLSGKSGMTALNFTGPYTTTVPQVGTSASLPAAVNLTGTASTAAATVDITTVTGGTVTVGPNQTNTPVPVSNMQPSLGLKICIATQGVWPQQPD